MRKLVTHNQMRALEDIPARSDVRERTRPGPRFPLGLSRAAAGLPGGFETLIHLAWLSDNPKVRAVAVRWNALSADQKRNAIPEDLCNDAGVGRWEFIHAVMNNGTELGIEMTGLMAGIGQEADATARLAAKAMRPGGIKAAEQFFEAIRVFGPGW